MHGIINWNDLKSRFGDENAIREMISDFMEIDVDYIGDLKNALESRNSYELQRQSQILKETAETIGAISLTDSARKLEMSAREQNLDIADAVMEEVQIELNKLQDLLSQSNWFEIIRP